MACSPFKYTPGPMSTKVSPVHESHCPSPWSSWWSTERRVREEDTWAWWPTSAVLWTLCLSTSTDTQLMHSTREKRCWRALWGDRVHKTGEMKEVKKWHTKLTSLSLSLSHLSIHLPLMMPSVLSVTLVSSGQLILRMAYTSTTSLWLSMGGRKSSATSLFCLWYSRMSHNVAEEEDREII